MVFEKNLYQNNYLRMLHLTFEEQGFRSIANCSFTNVIAKLIKQAIQ